MYVNWQLSRKIHDDTIQISINEVIEKKKERETSNINIANKILKFLA